MHSVLTYGWLASFAESVVGKSFHETCFTNTTRANNDNLKFEISGSGRHLPAAWLSPQSGGRVRGAPAATAGGPPWNIIPRIHQWSHICDYKTNRQITLTGYRNNTSRYLQLSFVSDEVCESLSVADSCSCSAIRDRGHRDVISASGGYDFYFYKFYKIINRDRLITCNQTVLLLHVILIY